jgi:aryl-alcohol dehydrogenase-like predicted oxidoreductase
LAATFSALLDAMFERGLNTIDTADVYSAWAPGNRGGESETIIGNWLRQTPGRRKEIVLFTKVGSEMPGLGGGLSKRWILQAVEESLRRLRTDFIDLYFTHRPDPKTPYDETLAALQTLREQGKIRATGGSQLNATQLREALDVAAAKGLPRYQVLQPEYNLYDRDTFEGPLQQLCVSEGLGVVTYYGLASGFLSGKYRSEADLSQSARGETVRKYFNARGWRILAALDQVAARLNSKPATIALSWLMAQPGVTAPIVSATTPAQLSSLLEAAEIALSPDDLAVLTSAGA